MGHAINKNWEVNGSGITQALHGDFRCFLSLRNSCFHNEDIFSRLLNPCSGSCVEEVLSNLVSSVTGRQRPVLQSSISNYLMEFQLQSRLIS